jgi:signal transduction histidine kinase
VLAEIVAPGPVTLLTGADFAVGACYAMVGAWLLRARGRSRDGAGTGTERPAGSPASGWLALAVSAAWFAGTALSALPAALSFYGAGVAVLGYRAMLTHLLLRNVTHLGTPSRRAAVSARLLIVLCYAAVLLPVPANGFVTAGLMAVLEVRYAIPGRGWIDEQGRPVESPPVTGPGTDRVTRVPAPGGGEVALIGGAAAEARSALSRAAAVAAALALENARISAEVREQAEAVRESRKRLLAVADEERQALASRLRAGPGELLHQVDQLLAGLDGESARDIRGQLAGAVTDLEQLALGLFPATLGSRPVGVLVREIAAGMPVPVQMDVNGPVEDLPPGLRALVYFFCSECLANMAKHSRASAATVRMDVAAGRLIISVGDDGCGGASLANSRGLRGLADRIEVAGGIMSVVSPPDGPTRISAEVPTP